MTTQTDRRTVIESGTAPGTESGSGSGGLASLWQTVDDPDGDHAAAHVSADAVIAQMIALKDPQEIITAATWRRVADLLHICTDAIASSPTVAISLREQAFAAVDDALSALTVGGGPIDFSPPGAHSPTTVVSLLSADDALAAVRRNCLRLAHLLFALDVTTPASLATRLNQLRRALVAWRVALPATTRQ